MSSLNTAITGLQSSQKWLDVISNNISNSQTVAYKEGRLTFSDLISSNLSSASAPSTSNNLGGINPNQIGLGVTVGSVQAIMNHKMIIDVDHSELSEKGDIIAMAQQQSPGYPLVSMHGAHGGLTVQMAKDILNLGGVIYPYKPNGRGEAEFIQRIKKILPAGKTLAVGYGFDGNGFGGLATPRGAGSTPVKYPFTMFSDTARMIAMPASIAIRLA